LIKLRRQRQFRTKYRLLGIGCVEMVKQDPCF
jgi:hypothetical protein